MIQPKPIKEITMDDEKRIMPVYCMKGRFNNLLDPEGNTARKKICGPKIDTG